jgi:hypothetical protein
MQACSLEQIPQATQSSAAQAEPSGERATPRMPLVAFYRVAGANKAATRGQVIRVFNTARWSKHLIAAFGGVAPTPFFTRIALNSEERVFKNGHPAGWGYSSLELLLQDEQAVLQGTEDCAATLEGLAQAYRCACALATSPVAASPEVVS